MGESQKSQRVFLVRLIFRKSAIIDKFECLQMKKEKKE